MTSTERNTISRFQHYAVKRIQWLPTSTHSDKDESMLGLNRLPSQIESPKLMFLYQILLLASNSVTRNICIRKLVFINNISLVSTGFIPDICNILFKYNLLSLVNNIMVPTHIYKVKGMPSRCHCACSKCSPSHGVQCDCTARTQRVHSVAGECTARTLAICKFV